MRPTDGLARRMTLRRTPQHPPVLAGLAACLLLAALLLWPHPAAGTEPARGLHIFVSLWAIAFAVLAAPPGESGETLRQFPPGGAGVPAVPGTELFSGPRVPPPDVRNPYAGAPQAIAQGRQFYHAFNCAGCHFAGGGGIGPALMDDQWIYGDQPGNVFESIAKGRPNGMPAYGGMLSEDHIWRLVAYVQSLNQGAREGGGTVEQGR
jgi:mono/diheme cytochrome c family protein